MTETQNQQPAPAADTPRRPERKPTLGSRPAFWPTAILVSASFLLMFEFLSFQLTHGKDPALGGSGSSAAAKPARPVLIRRVVNTRVVADGGSGTTGSTNVSSGSASSGSSAASGAAAAAPAPAPAPAAPVVSGSS
jgi:hypothetical protein